MNTPTFRRETKTFDSVNEMLAYRREKKVAETLKRKAERRAKTATRSGSAVRH